MKKQILRSISIRSLLEKILVVLSESPFAEVEEFSTLQFDNVPAERLPFTHPSSLYGLTALMYWREFLTKEEQICLHRQVLNILQKFNSNKNSGVDLRNVNLQSRSNPVLYPISYLLQLLSAYGDAIRS